jgi:hypothetical protein
VRQRLDAAQRALTVREAQHAALDNERGR